MPMSTDRGLPEMAVNAAQLYREEVFTDRRVGTIRKLVPVRADGSDDTTREPVFEGQTSLLTPAGSLPLTFEIEAGTLAQAVEKFADAARAALDQTLQELEEIRREAASSIVVPGRGSPGLGGISGLGGLPGGGKIRMP
jgi:hypothetical protein